MSAKTINNAKSPKANQPGTERGANGEPKGVAEVKIGDEKPIDPTLLPIGDPAGAA